jgi:hypothetical protein
MPQRQDVIMPGYRELWRAGERLLRDLDLPRPFSVAAVSDAVRRVRGRPLVILPLPVPASDESPYGLWAEYPDADYILHEAGTSPAHRDQIILHEIAHVLLGHGAAAGFPAPISPAGREPVSSLGVDQAAAMMARHAYGSSEEWHAEILASLLMECTEELSPLPLPGDLLSQIGDALRHPVTRRGR